MRSFVLALLASLTGAFMVTPVGVKAPLLSSAARATTPTALVPEAAVSLPTAMTIADDSSLLLASGGLIGFLFIFLVVGTVVTNFGIMKK